MRIFLIVAQCREILQYAQPFVAWIGLADCHGLNKRNRKIGIQIGENNPLPASPKISEAKFWGSGRKKTAD
jgi:hypothetical protein